MNVKVPRTTLQAQVRQGEVRRKTGVYAEYTRILSRILTKYHQA